MLSVAQGDIGRTWPPWSLVFAGKVASRAPLGGISLGASATAVLALVWVEIVCVARSGSRFALRSSASLRIHHMAPAPHGTVQSRGTRCTLARAPLYAFFWGHGSRAPLQLVACHAQRSAQSLVFRARGLFHLTLVRDLDAQGRQLRSSERGRQMGATVSNPASLRTFATRAKKHDNGRFGCRGCRACLVRSMFSRISSRSPAGPSFSMPWTAGARITRARFARGAILALKHRRALPVQRRGRSTKHIGAGTRLECAGDLRLLSALGALLHGPDCVAGGACVARHALGHHLKLCAPGGQADTRGTRMLLRQGTPPRAVERPSSQPGTQGSSLTYLKRRVYALGATAPRAAVVALVWYPWEHGGSQI